MKHILYSLICACAFSASVARAESLLQYKPAQIGAPSHRTGGATRGLPKLVAEPAWRLLAPNDTALTATPQPVLYWYRSEADQQRLRLTLWRKSDGKIILQREMTDSSAGVHAVNLTEQVINLEPNEDYLWSIDPVSVNERPDSLTVSAEIRFQPRDDNNGSDAATLAQTGYWYDALRILMDAHSEQTAGFLAQIGVNVTLPW